MNMIAYRGILPRIAEDVFIAPGACIIGDVEIGEHSSIWFNTVVRGDVHYIKIGSSTNIQDNSVLHPTGLLFPIDIGDRVLIGHNVVIHGMHDRRRMPHWNRIDSTGWQQGRERLVYCRRFPAAARLRGPARIGRDGRAGQNKKKDRGNERAMIAHGWPHYVELAAEYFKAQSAMQAESERIAR